MKKEIVSCTALNHMSLATAKRNNRILLMRYERLGGRFRDVVVRERRPSDPEQSHYYICNLERGSYEDRTNDNCASD